MGIVNKPNVIYYRSTTAFFPATISRTRFVQILRYLHFVDDNLAPRPDLPDDNKRQIYGKKAVMCLMEPFVDKGRYLFMDNYYTSVDLFEELEKSSTLACGTVRSNRVRPPREICNLKSIQVKQLKRGDSLYRQKGTMTYVTWCDRKVVSVLATVPTSEADSGEVERSVKVKGQ